jgi:hypothetical protein
VRSEILSDVAENSGLLGYDTVSVGEWLSAPAVWHYAPFKVGTTCPTTHPHIPEHQNP